MYLKIFLITYVVGLIFGLYSGLRFFFEKDHKFGSGWKNPFARYFILLCAVPLVNLQFIFLTGWYLWASLRKGLVDSVREKMMPSSYLVHDVTRFIPFDPAGKKIMFTRIDKVQLNRCINCFKNGAEAEDDNYDLGIQCTYCGQERDSVAEWNNYNRWATYIARYLNKKSMFSLARMHFSPYVDNVDFHEFLKKDLKDERS